MNRIIYSFQEISMQKVAIVLKGYPLPPSINPDRLVWVVASLALFVFAAFTGCLAAYLFRPHKLNGLKGSFPSSRKNNNAKKLILSSSLNPSQTKKLTHSIPTTTSKERLNLSSQKPLSIDFSEIISKKEDTKGTVDSNSFAQSPPLDNASLTENPFIKTCISLNDKRTASWINDNPDVSLSELGMSTYDEILDFLKNHGNQLKSLNLEKFNCTDDEFKAFIQLCPQIQHLFVSSRAITDEALEHLKGMLLTSVNFRNCNKLTDKALEHLKGMPLTRVNFSSRYLNLTNLTDKALEHLKGMPLTSVDFSHCEKLTDNALEHLKGMPLTSVDFSLCEKLTDKALEHLKGMPLTTVNFSYCKYITNKAFEHLKGMPLTSVNFCYCYKLTDKALEHLKGMPLTSVDFTDCEQLTDRALEYLKGMPLTSVKFGFCHRLTDKALEHLKGMPLKNIYFYSCKTITDNALKDLRLSCGIGVEAIFPSSDKSNVGEELVLSSSSNDSQTKNLTHSIPTTTSKERLNPPSQKPLSIDFSNTMGAVDSNSFAQSPPLDNASLTGNPLIKKASISLNDKRTASWINDNPDVSLSELGMSTYDEILDFLKNHGNQLKSLNLGKFKCTDDAFKAFIQLCPQIQHLFVSSPAITDEALEHLKGMPLTSVDFSGCYELTDNALEYLKGMPLTSVNFGRCNQLTDNALEHLKGMPLTSVDFSSCEQLTDKALEHLKGMPLKSISFFSCKKITDNALKDLRLSCGI